MEAIGEEALKLIEDEGYALVWSRDGQTRAVPRFIIEDALRLYRDGQKGLKDSPLAHMLPKVHGISWAQAGLSEVNFALDPSVAVGKQTGGGGGVKTPAE